MKFDDKKSCFVNDDGSKLELTESLVNQYPLDCYHSTHEGIKYSNCLAKLQSKWLRYLTQELLKH